MFGKITYFCTPGLLRAALDYCDQASVTAGVGDARVAGIFKWSTDLNGKRGETICLDFSLRLTIKPKNSISDCPVTLSAMRIKVVWKSSISMNKLKFFMEGTAQNVKNLYLQNKIHWKLLYCIFKNFSRNITLWWTRLLDYEFNGKKKVFKLEKFKMGLLD